MNMSKDEIREYSDVERRLLHQHYFKIVTGTNKYKCTVQDCPYEKVNPNLRSLVRHLMLVHGFLSETDIFSIKV